MIECLPVGGRWTWTLLSPAGRVLVYTLETFETQDAAALSAKDYRSGFWRVADQTDHRQARAI